jgi:uncharacterized protein (DUF2461 family)
LLKIRRHIVAEPAVFSRLIKNKSLTGYYTGFSDEGKLARPPKGFAADAPHMDFLKQKSFIMVRELPVGGMTGERLLKEVEAGFKVAFPLVKWLRAAVAGAK